jgi:hypothetical protein
MTGHASDKTIGEAFRENQDAVITTMALLSVLGAVRKDCGCTNCRVMNSCHVMTAVELRDRLASACEITNDQVTDLMAGATRRIVKGVPS